MRNSLLGFAEYYMGLRVKPFSCDRCNNDSEFIWKTRHDNETKILAIYYWCKDKGYNHHSAEYLKNAERDMFTAISNRLNGKTTSRVERLIRTVNTRTNIGKWSTQGVLNVTKIRLAYYYNGFDA